MLFMVCPTRLVSQNQTKRRKLSPYDNPMKMALMNDIVKTIKVNFCDYEKRRRNRKLNELLIP